VCRVTVCVGLKKKYIGGLRLSPIFLKFVTLIPRTVACCGYLPSNQKVLIYTTYIKKAITKLYSFTQRSKITDKNNRSDISQRSEISLDTGPLSLDIFLSVVSFILFSCLFFHDLSRLLSYSVIYVCFFIVYFIFAHCCVLLFLPRSPFAWCSPNWTPFILVAKGGRPAYTGVYYETNIWSVSLENKHVVQSNSFSRCASSTSVIFSVRTPRIDQMHESKCNTATSQFTVYVNLGKNPIL